ncbi:(2Fe-2S) ferredoxin domain-containing protein [Desulfospira joergensenii]|uniref:(2Fe-2S) ferredoxin domain-containing protein n=1 Tax=Desulfospira joergensenii TaxID=53329 RepID=UPI0003B33742|nr:(2Fe-2S) ferredoxin domain-containing protein [Desulfospira joergensenii]
MEKPKHHILVCASFRPNGELKGKCHRKNSVAYLPYIENEIIDRGLEDVIVSSTCCLKLCDQGPVMVIYPENTWYGNVDSEDAIDEILDALEDGEIAKDYVLN